MVLPVELAGRIAELACRRKPTHYVLNLVPVFPVPQESCQAAHGEHARLPNRGAVAPSPRLVATDNMRVRKTPG